MLTTYHIINYALPLFLIFIGLLLVPQIFSMPLFKTEKGYTNILYFGLVLASIIFLIFAIVIKSILLLSSSLFLFFILLSTIVRMHQKQRFNNQLSLQQVLDQIPANIYWKDIDGRFLGANRTNLDYFGIENLKVYRGKTDYDLFPNDIATNIVSVDKKVIDTGNEIITLEKAINKENFEREFLTHKIPLKHNKEIIGVLGVSFDITHTNKEVRDRFKMLEHIIALMPGHVYWVDIDGVYLGCNDNQARSAGLSSRDAIVGLRNIDLPWNQGAIELCDKLDDANKEVIKTGKTIITEEPGYSQNGDELIYLSTKVPLYDSNNHINGMVGISIDITDKKQLELAEKTKEILHKQIESLELVANTIAHELRTPLGIIRGETKLLNLKSKKLQEQEQEGFIKHLEKIKRQVAQLNMFINIMIENAKNIEQLDLVSVHALPVIEEVIKEYPYNDDSDAKLIHIDEVENFEFQGDAHFFKHVIINLVKNSLFYIQKNGKGEIWLSTESDVQFDYLYFMDTAEGVARGQIDEIFKDYYTKSGVGTGIGLAFCRRVMKAFGGDITCDSKLGEYIKFTMRFPKA